MLLWQVGEAEPLGAVLSGRRGGSVGDAWRMQGKCGAGSLMYSFSRLRPQTGCLETTNPLSPVPRLEIQTQGDSGFVHPPLTLGGIHCLSASGDPGCSWLLAPSFNLCPHLHMASPAMPLPLKSPG